MSLEERIADVREKIDRAARRGGRSGEDVRLIAVTKYVSPQTAQEVFRLGVQHIGENRLEGFERKYEVLGNEPCWHFIGTLQSKKVKKVIDRIDYLHSLDRLSLAREIEKRAVVPKKCFVQVNVSGEASKHGISPEEVPAFIEKLAEYRKIEVVGLMTMAPFTRDQALLRQIFRQTAALRDRIASYGWRHAPCRELSMGMTNDFELAVEEGATFVRIGSAIVGHHGEQKEG